ncbi:alpha-L-fucosidase [Arthrobacter stackebrandtii]|uniref:alpha-L-fucosidase n=1 Tax=Arthrobacter stackebrandtii TaxID=272161 RepID=A0ABS4YSM2_9MICC|nr:alpha-L-fucosidase [Arthrobacter stackebrandtii]MBP2411789.1 alpha-L-fucosidase [Arthrobacter stackebrandtii]PYG99181.1 alpha-L-fucosidase [Arthrobacter stackebrandtii]
MSNEIDWTDQKVHDPKTEAPLGPNSAEHTEPWFKAAGLGMFIHYDHASQQGLEASWPLLGGVAGLGYSPTALVADYHSTADSFDPEHWDPAALARKAAAAGMTYAVFTARHHSGWSSWPSKASGRTIESSPYGRRGGDLVREYTEAFRAAGIKVGLYYSLSDWGHAKYPAFTDEMRPYQHGRYPRAGAADWSDYQQYLKDQLTELLTWYGPIDLLWFDGEWERTREEWDAAGLEAHIRSLAPEIVINDRLIGSGDYRTPEQFIPAQPLAEPWECCMTMCDTWSYVPEDQNYKSLHEIVRTAVEVVAKGGNLLLNVGPTADGSLAPEQSALLDGLAGWMACNKEAVHGVQPGLEPWQYYGPSTAAGNNTYLFALAKPVETVTVRSIPGKRVTAVRHLGSGAQLPFTFRTTLDDRFLSDPLGELNIDVREIDVNGVVPVFVLEMDPQPRK